MNKETSNKLVAELQEYSGTVLRENTGKEFRLFTEKDSNGGYEIKVFERNPDGTISGGIISIFGLVDLAEKFKTHGLIRTEWKDGKGTQGRPYFLFFNP
jgi:hypothetical protein